MKKETPKNTNKKSGRKEILDDSESESGENKIRKEDIFNDF